MRRLLRLFSLAVAGIVLGLTLYAGLVHIGLARSLLAPTLRGDIALARSDRPGLRVLFVGNSFTFRNALVAMVHDLAVYDRGAPQLFAVEYAAPGWTLEDAAANHGLEHLLDEAPWNIVVLQEQILYYVLPAFFTLYLIYGFVRPRISRKVRHEIEEEDEEDETRTASPE